MNSPIPSLLPFTHWPTYWKRERKREETDRQTDTKSERHTHRETDREAERQKDRQTDKQKAERKRTMRIRVTCDCVDDTSWYNLYSWWGIGVCPLSMSVAIDPLSFICVSIDIGVGAITLSRSPYPVTCVVYTCQTTHTTMEFCMYTVWQHHNNYFSIIRWQAKEQSLVIKERKYLSEENAFS